MKIVHICLAGPFSDNHSYQENLLTKYHVRQGNEVAVITSTFAINTTGKVVNLDQHHYINDNGVEVFRIGMKGKQNFNKKLKRFNSFDSILKNLSPDIIFIHGTQFLNIKSIIEYKKLHNNIRVYADNHADFSNSATNFISREILHKVIWKYTSLKLEPIVSKFYGVLPARVDFLINQYSIPEKKVELLNLGGDDDYIFTNTDPVTKKIRTAYNIKADQKLLITGGKIDSSKKEVLLLMEYVQDKKDLVLIIFGSIEKSLKKEFESLLSENVIYTGWVNVAESYQLFASSDIVVFPGRHSVYWEQVVSQKKPLIVKHWEKTAHIDIGGNVSFVDYEITEKEKLFNHLNKVLYTDKLINMTEAAKSEKSESFLYSNIAQKSILVSGSEIK